MKTGGKSPTAVYKQGDAKKEERGKPYPKKKMPTGCKQIAWCVLAYLAINALLALVLTFQDESSKFPNMFLVVLANDISEKGYVGAKAIKTISDVIILAALGGYVYSLIMSLHIGIVIPDNLILRRSPQDDKNGTPMLSFMLGNKSKYYRFDVSCEITCVFQKEIGEDPVHTQMIEHQSVSMIDNYYRFSFKASKIPAQFWRNYSEYLKNSQSEQLNKDNNYVAVLVSGSSNFLGGRFTILREYPFSKIIFNNEKPDDDAHGFRDAEKIIHWDEFKKWPCGKCIYKDGLCRDRDEAGAICAEKATDRKQIVEQMISDGKDSDK